MLCDSSQIIDEFIFLLRRRSVYGHEDAEGWKKNRRHKMKKKWTNKVNTDNQPSEER